MAISEPTEDIHKLAVAALNEAGDTKAREFRIAASRKGNFQKALTDYGHAIINSEEISYCEGWLALARLEFGDMEDDLDHHLVVRVRATLQEAGTTRSG